jgi:hypothetical protein
MLLEKEYKKNEEEYEENKEEKSHQTYQVKVFKPVF